MVFCTEFLDGWWSWDPLRRSCLRCGWCRAPSAPYTVALNTTTHPKTRCTKPYAATHHLMLMMVYVPETYRAKNTSIKLPSCIKLAFHIISWGRCRSINPQHALLFNSKPVHISWGGWGWVGVWFTLNLYQELLLRILLLGKLIAAQLVKNLLHE